MPAGQSASALRSGLINRVIAVGAADYRAQVAAQAEQLARSRDYPARLAAKAQQLTAAEKHRPLAAYRAAELAIMSRNFSGPREPYADLRRAFVYKEKPPRTPPHLARHRTRPWPSHPERPSAQETTDRPSPREDHLAAHDRLRYTGLRR